MDDSNKPTDDEFFLDPESDGLEELSETSDGLEELSDTSDGLEELSETSDGLEELSETSGGLEEVDDTSDGLEEVSETSDGLEEVSDTSDGLEETIASGGGIKEADKATDDEFYTHPAAGDPDEPAATGKPTDDEFFSGAAAEEEQDEFEELPLSEEEPEPVDEEPDEEPEEEPKTSLVDKFKGLPKRTQIIAGAGAGVAVLGVAWYFIFGGEEKEPRRAAPQAQKPPLPPVVNPDETEDPADQDPAEGEPGEESTDPETPEGTPEETPEEVVPARPENVAQWKRDDYVSARVEGDPKLLDAVKNLGESYRGTANAPQAAELLTGLLAPLAAEETTQPRHRTSRGGPAGDLTEAVVAALVSLEDDRAQQILGELLSGGRPTENDAGTVQAVLSAVAANLNPRGEGLLYRAFTQAEQIRPAGRGDVSSDELRKLTYDTLVPIASQRFRLELAKYLMKPTTPSDRREEFSEMLLTEEPKNIAAQMFLWQNRGLEDETREELEAYFLSRSSALLAHALGLPGEPVGSRRPGRRPPSRTAPVEPVDEAAVHAAMAQWLWGQWFAGHLGPMLKDTESLEESADLVVLGSTIPSDTMRAAVYDALEDNWEQGPDAVEQAGLDGEVLVDPALLLAIKALPRSVPRDTSGRPRTSRSTSRSGSRTSGSVPQAILEKEEAQQAWMLTSETMVRTWCERLHQSAVARAEAARSAGQTPPRDHAVGSLARRAGFTLHQGANVTAEYHHEYPGDFAKQATALLPGPVVVDYIRIEEVAKPMAMLGYYRRQMRFRDAMEVENGAWCDQVRPVPQTDRQRSLDMLITRVEPADDESTGEPEPLVVEILSIEAKNPTGL